ncbi:MAG: serine hydrolase [Hyphomicrobiales bacterium]|nr:MAG: serine hydrolase [Hyphomicrobiales bacterium]
MRPLFTLLALLAGLMAMPALAQDKEIAVLRAVLAEGPVDISLFSAGFLAAVPPPQLEPIVTGIKTQVGPVLEVTPKGGAEFIVETATHEMESTIVLDGDGKIGGLLFRPAVARNQSIEDILGEMDAIAPEVSYLVTENGVRLYGKNEELALAIGSAFKLGVLKALRDEVDAGARQWGDVVELEAGDVSLPSGMLQNWPVGSALTLQTLASLMISISDNTATDVLMRVVGREKVEAALGTAPALTTRELFTLKANRDLLARYQAGDLAAKREVLAEQASMPLPDMMTTPLTPHDKGAEWYQTPAQLCALIESVGDLGATQINPGAASKADWASVSFKGGSEIGVLNMTTLLVAKDGTRFCVAASWNDSKAIVETRATSAYATLLAKLRK